MDTGPGSELDSLRAFARAHGVPAEDAEGISDPFELASMIFDAVLIPCTDRFTLDEVASSAGVDRGSTQRLWRALGFPDPPVDARVAGEIDVEALRQVTSTLEGQDALDNSIRQTRIYSAAIARITELWVDELRSTLDAGVPLAVAIPSSLPQLDQERAALLLDYVHRRLLAAGLRRELTSRSIGATAERGVAFADLVGFTTLSERLGPLGLSKLIETFEGLAYDTVAIHGGRVVKTIGDEVLYTAEDPQIVLDIADVMLAESAALGLPPLRIGAEYGVAVWYEGDLYGPAVNRASRIVAEAAPGSVTASTTFSSAMPQRSWRARGPFDLKGIGEVELVDLVPNG